MNHRTVVSKGNRLNPSPIYDGPHIFRVRSSRSQPDLRSDRDENDSDSKNRATLRCNWPDFLKKKIRYAIHSPYALCNLTPNEQRRENRPVFVNYGGYYQDHQHGEKRTYNSLAIHQMKHRQTNNQQRFRRVES